MGILKTTMENLAERIAASQGGRITANDLIPYLPVSLSIIEKHLDEMVDDCVFFSAVRDGIKTYEFAELIDAEPRPMPKGVCIHCGDDAPVDEGMSLCYACHDGLGRDLLKLAESTAWPAEAIWQHELLYIMSTADGPIRIADVAGRSRLTLSQVKTRLAELARRGFARQVMDYRNKTATYEMPPIHYRRAAYRRQDKFIRLHPSSLKDEWEVKIVKSLVVLVAALLACFVLRFLIRWPLPILLAGGAAVAAALVGRIVLHKTDVEPGQIGRDNGANNARP